MNRNSLQSTLSGNRIFEHKLTWRQKQTLTSIFWRSNNFGKVTFSDVVGDVGVAFVTLAGHLKSLQSKNILEKTKVPLNMTFCDELKLTELGRKMASDFLKNHNLTINNPLDVIFDKLKVDYENMPHKVQKTGFYLNSGSTFSKAFNELIKGKNLTEPIISSIALYTELDSQLNLIKTMDRDTYLSLTKSKLNIEIRTGRLASIALPIMLHGKMPQIELKNVLGYSWSWLGTVQNRQINRYMNEAISLGLIQQNGGLITSLKPTTTDIVSWLANKTGETFLNTMNIAPKASLLVFKESFNLPTIEDLLYPQNSDIDELNWCHNIYDSISDKDVYRNYVSEAIDILVTKTKIVEEQENGRLVPRTVYRNIETAKDMKITFDTILKFSDNEDNKAAKILLSVTANPGITIEQLYHKINRNNDVQYFSLENMITSLANKGLLHIARSAFSKDYKTAKIYSFSHIPFINPNNKNKKESTETNAVLKGIEPWILSSINDYFSENTEKENLYKIIVDLLKDKFLDFDDIDNDFGKKMSRKTMAWIHTLVPFVEVSEDYSQLKISNTSLGNIVLDVLQYSLLTANDSLNIFSSVISDMIGKDKNMIANLENDALVLKKELIKKI